MACDRKGCDNIMCDTCIDSSYYICSECKEEFKGWLLTQDNLYLDSNKFIYEKFKEFMSIEKDIYNIPEDTKKLLITSLTYTKTSSFTMKKKTL